MLEVREEALEVGVWDCELALGGVELGTPVMPLQHLFDSRDIQVGVVRVRGR